MCIKMGVTVSSFGTLQLHLYYDVRVYQRSQHRVQYSCTLGNAFEARVHPCTPEYSEASMTSVVTQENIFLVTQEKHFLASIQKNCMLYHCTKKYMYYLHLKLSKVLKTIQSKSKIKQ